MDAAEKSRLEAVVWLPLISNVDSRGLLTAIESEKTIPFPIKRVYFLSQVTADRGGHAHRYTKQVIVAANGSFDLSLSDGITTRNYEFRDSSQGLYLEPMTFIRLSNFSPDAVVIVFANTHYDRSASIHSWEEYLDEVR
jgi:WxcM-like, C-terminal